MKLDDDICYCYHVSLRKLINFAKREEPEVPSRMSECLGAGTGCGWCIPFLEKIARNPDRTAAEDLEPDQYAADRKNYIQAGEPRNAFSD